MLYNVTKIICIGLYYIYIACIVPVVMAKEVGIVVVEINFMFKNMAEHKFGYMAEETQIVGYKCPRQKPK